MSENIEYLDEESRAIREADTGRKAARILEDETFREAVKTVQDDIYEAFPSAAPEELPRLQLKLLMLNEVLKVLETHMDTGVMAQSTLDLIREKAGKVKDRFIG